MEDAVAKDKLGLASAVAVLTAGGGLVGRNGEEEGYNDNDDGDDHVSHSLC